MKKSTMYSLVLGSLVLPQVVHASGFENALGGSTIWIAIVIGLVTSVTVWMHAQRIKGGVLGSVYQYFSIGMLLTVLALVAVSVPAWAESFIVESTHDLLFVLGYGVMALAARKMLTESGITR